MSHEQLQALRQYTACDISDALLALQQTETGQRKLAGFLCDLVRIESKIPESAEMVVGPAFTVQFQPKDPSTSIASFPKAEATNIEPGVQWSDLAEPGSIVLVQQPENQRSAAAGGIHMLRLAKKGVKAIVVEGRIRDQREVRDLNLLVFSRGTSIVSAGAEAKPYAVQVPVTISDIRIHPGDVLCVDPAEGAVCIPAGFVESVMQWLNQRGSSEDKIQEMIRTGSSVQQAFAKYR